MSDPQIDTMQLFFPEASKRLQKLSQSDTHLIHYTSAQNAMDIILSKQIWLRSTAVMNDFEEVSHGVNLVRNVAQSSAGDRLWAILDTIHAGLGGSARQFYCAISENIKHNTFITSLSEHPRSEDGIGRLSMWRAYGGSTGVGLVLKKEPFLSKPMIFPAFTSPVLYALDGDFRTHFCGFVDHIERHIDEIARLDPVLILENMASARMAAALSTKHIGFAEECEWRVIADIQQVDNHFLKIGTAAVRGVPQRVLKICLKDYGPDEIDVSIPMLLEKIIIGPTEYPQTIYDAFRDVLTNAGVPDAGSRITASGIPLRT